MFYALFRRLYLRMKPRIEEANHERIAKETPPDNVLRAEYTYLEDGDPLHRLNLYRQRRSSESSVLPLVIDIHGGGWLCGDKDTNGNFCAHLAEGGNIVASLSYRTIDRCTIQEQIQDIFACFHWLNDHQAESGADMSRTFLTGDSAGAQLALLACCVSQSRELQKLFSVTAIPFGFKGIILNHGVCYLNEAASLPNRKILSRCFLNPGLQRMLYGKGYSQMPLYLHTVVPGKYLLPQTALPPVLLITSKGDTAFSYQTIKLCEELKGMGKECTCYCEEDASAEHVFNIAYPDSEAGKKCNRQILNFIRKWS